MNGAALQMTLTHDAPANTAPDLCAAGVKNSSDSVMVYEARSMPVAVEAILASHHSGTLPALIAPRKAA